MSLILRGIDFGPVQTASGAQGWFGEGYWFHRFIPGLDWSGCTFVAKTTTLKPREGNMPLNKKWLPKSLLPKCIVVKPISGVILNSVGLSGPGSRRLFEEGEWQQRSDPFFLSFMSVAPTSDHRYNETCAFVEQIPLYQPNFKAPFGIQVNLSCCNTEIDPIDIATEAKEILTVFQSIRKSFNIPIVPKFSVLYPVSAITEIQDLCDAVCISNTIPWGQLPDYIDWIRLFPGRGSEDVNESKLYDPVFKRYAVNPLRRRGFEGGGLSGKPLLPLVRDWVIGARKIGVNIPIIAGGGILHPKDAMVLINAGADSIFLGSIAILRGWRLQETIRFAHHYLK